MIGPWINSPVFMGLLKDKYEGSHKVSTKILQDKNNGDTKAKDKSFRNSVERDS